MDGGLREYLCNELTPSASDAQDNQACLKGNFKKIVFDLGVNGKVSEASGEDLPNLAAWQLPT